MNKIGKRALSIRIRGRPSDDGAPSWSCHRTNSVEKVGTL
jgi:hypothetical protein